MTIPMKFRNFICNGFSHQFIYTCLVIKASLSSTDNDIV